MERRRRETVGRADLSADLTGAVLVQLVIDGDVGRVGRKSANQAGVTGLRAEEGINGTSTDKKNSSYLETHFVPNPEEDKSWSL